MRNLLDIGHRVGGASRDAAEGKLFVAAIVLTGSFFFVLTGTTRDIVYYDEGFVLTDAFRVASGELPHRDFFASYGPAQYYVLAGAFKLFGHYVLVERLYDALVKALIASVVFIIIAPIASTSRSVVASTLAIIWLTYSSYPGYPIWPSLLFTVISTLFLLRALDGSRVYINLFLSGLCVGIVTLFRYDVGVLAAVGLLGGLAVCEIVNPNSQFRPTLLRLLYFAFGLASGSAAILIPAAIIYAAKGMVGDFVYQVVEFPSRYYVTMRSLPFPSPEAITLSSLPKYIVYLPPFVSIFGLAVAAKTRDTFRANDQRDRGMKGNAMLIISVVTLSLYVKGLVRVSELHMALSIIPSLILITIVVNSAAPSGSWLFAKEAAILVSIAVAILSLTALVTVARRAHGNGFGWIASNASAKGDGDVSCFTTNALSSLRCFRVSQDIADAITFILKTTSPSERILVATNHHDHVFGNNVAFYFLAKRLPVTKWHEYNPGLQTERPIQEEMISELRNASLPKIVVDPEWDNIREPNRSSRSSGVVILDRFITENYTIARKFGSIRILAPK